MNISTFVAADATSSRVPDVPTRSTWTDESGNLPMPTPDKKRKRPATPKTTRTRAANDRDAARGDLGAGDGLFGAGTESLSSTDDAAAMPRPALRPSVAADEVQPLCPVVGMGASAGGLEAYLEFFKPMPADCGLSFVVIVHLDPTNVSMLPELLQKHTAMPVQQAEDGARILPNSVYVIPPNKDLHIFNGVLHLMDRADSRAVNLPINTFFRSLAEDQRGNAIGIVLSGTGSDGTLGLRAIKADGGLAIVQDPDTAKYDGMPASAIAAGLADYVLAPAAMPAAVIAYSHRVRGTDTETSPVAATIPAALQKICMIIRAHTKHDFSLYKKNTICRRVARRMHVHQIDDVEHYLRYLQEDKHEVTTLFKELLIGVTHFFRDPSAFDILRSKLLPDLLKAKSSNYTIRAWVPGCSSGEEAYSIAITMMEVMEDLNQYFNVQIFGTDIDDDAIGIARSGLYPASIANDVGRERLRRHFVEEKSGFRVKQQIREMLVFATQNIIRDPPFTKLDLISCRNLLIYLSPEAQNTLMPTFHFGLKPDGLLLLGTSETTGRAADMFTVADRKAKLYIRRQLDVTDCPRFNAAGLLGGEAAPPHFPAASLPADESLIVKITESILQHSDTPACAVIDQAQQVVYIHGRTGRFLEPAPGIPNTNIVDMARPGLQTSLAAAIAKVKKETQAVVVPDVRVDCDSSTVHLRLTVQPILAPGALYGMMMVIFEVADAARQKSGSRSRSKHTSTRTIPELEQDLQNTRENLQTTIEELETSNEELKSTNEELQSTNEELQSTNEELETSKEELQSLNEESTTINSELQCKIDDLSRSRNDIRNLLNNASINVLFLDRHLRVRLFTPAFNSIANLVDTDIGRPIEHFATNLRDSDLKVLSEHVLETLSPVEKEVITTDDRYFAIRIMPYRTTENVIDGVVITLNDITARKASELITQRAAAFARNVVDAVRDPLLVLDADLRVRFANTNFYRFFDVSSDETEGRLVYRLGNGQWDIPALRKLLEKILPEESVFDDFEVDLEFKKIGRKTIMLHARKIDDESAAGSTLILLVCEDVTGKHPVNAMTSSHQTTTTGET